MVSKGNDVRCDIEVVMWDSDVRGDVGDNVGGDMG